MSFELVPYADIKALLGLNKDAMSDYPALGVIHIRLLSSFQEETGRYFELKERVENIYVNDTPVCMIPLKALPVATIGTVEVTSTISGDDSVTSGDYEVTEYGIKLLGKVNNCKVAVTYTGGLSAVTDEISAAALYQLAYEYQSKEQIGATSMFTEGGSVSRPELGLLKETKRMLNSSWHPLKL